MCASCSIVNVLTHVQSCMQKDVTSLTNSASLSSMCIRKRQSEYSPHEKAFEHQPCPAGVLNGLQSSNWKQRLTSMEEVQQQVQDMKENLEGINSVLIQGMSFLPGWSEKNFQVGLLI